MLCDSQWAAEQCLRQQVAGSAHVDLVHSTELGIMIAVMLVHQLDCSELHRTKTTASPNVNMQSTCSAAHSVYARDSLLHQTKAGVGPLSITVWCMPLAPTSLAAL
jgi:hypothetical protein